MITAPAPSPNRDTPSRPPHLCQSRPSDRLCSPATIRSYAYALLRWFRFLHERFVRCERAERGDVHAFVEPHPGGEGHRITQPALPRHRPEPHLVAIAALAQDLLTWCTRLALPATAAGYEPKTQRPDDPGPEHQQTTLSRRPAGPPPSDPTKKINKG
jgi:hypothetical protein